MFFKGCLKMRVDLHFEAAFLLVSDILRCNYYLSHLQRLPQFSMTSLRHFEVVSAPA